MTISMFFLVNFSSAQWNPNTSENLLIATQGIDVMQSCSTTDAKTWIAYYHNNAGVYEMWAQLIDPNGNKLLGPDGILVSNQPTGSATYVFNVCVDAANNLIIGCQDQRTGTMQCVLYKVSQTGVELWGANGIILGAGLSPYQAVLSTGEVISAFNASTGSTLNIQKITVNGTLAWPAPKAILVGTTKTTRGQPVAAPNGQFTMVFQKKGVGIGSTLYVQKYDSAGGSLYSPVQISTLTASQARYYSIQQDNDTTYFGYYVASGSRFNSYLQRINPNGSLPWGTGGSNFNTSIASTDSYQGTTNIRLTPGSPYVWSVCTFSNPAQTQYGVYVQKFLKSAATGALARQFTDAAKVVYPITSSMDQQVDNVVLVNDAPMFMTYDVNYKIYATRLDANGDFVWPFNRVEISSTTAGGSTPKGRFGFTADGPNRCIGVWYENRGGTYMGYAQGVSIGGIVTLKVYTQGNVPAVINTLAGSLPMVDTIVPATANQNVNWSIVPGTGSATITGTGIVNAISDGTVWAKAVSAQDNTVVDSLLITISGQIPCGDPTALTVSQITSYTATLTWTAPGNLPGSGYRYEVRTSGAPGSGSTGLVTTGTTAAGVTTAAITGLTENTPYYAYVQSNCGDGNFSAWTAATIFTTLPETIYVVGSVNESHATCYNATMSIIVAGSGTTFDIHDGGSATFISGQKISFLAGTTVYLGGYMHGYITLTNEYCQNPANPIVSSPVNATGVEIPAVNFSDMQTVRVYPNPATSAFTVELTGLSDNSTSRIEMLNMSGSTVMSRELMGESKYQFSIGDMANGIYIICITTGPKVKTVKLVKM